MGLSASRRVVAVHGRRQGTGVLLDPRHILTCAHVVGDGTTAEVVHPETGQRTRCAVVWTGTADATDAALLRGESEVIPAAGLGRLRWGRPTGDDPLPGCQAIGFPHHQRYGGRTTTGPRDGEGQRSRRLDFGQYRGSVLPVAGRLRGALTFWLDHSPGAVPPRGPVPLAGLSGAPVFAGPVLLGIVARVRETEGQQHLETVPLEPVRRALSGEPGPEAEAEAEAEAAPGAGRPGLVPGRPGAGRPGLVPGLPRLEKVSGFDPRDGAFEERYTGALRAQYAKTEVFGIDELGISESSWDLDTAYLSLEATRPGDEEILWFTGHGTPQTAPPDPRPGPRRVEELLGLSRRTLLRGEAGAGKTTLVWWLAAHAACGTLPAELDRLNGLVPFVVPLRAVRNRGGAFPGPDALAEVAELPVGRAPEGWAERVLDSGRALLLVDGFDELPQNARPRARAWLTGLLRRHSDIDCLATVRPGAVEADWLTGEGFADLLLLPMSDTDIDAFVTAWHGAALVEYAALDQARIDGEARRLNELERELHREFAGHRVLRDLARTPLLCAVICALHRKRRGRLPRSRWELYRATLDMLLGKRDSERGIGTPEGLAIEVDEHKLLLQHIAVWLVRGGQSQLTPGEARTQIERAVAAMPQLAEQGDSQQILTHLLNRSGLLQQRTGDTVHFIHRTFQDYLAAKEFADTDSVRELCLHADDEQWQDVVRLSVGHFERRVGRLIEQLTEAGDRNPGGRSVHILAMECAASAVFLDEGIRAEAERRIRELMPPRDAREAAALAAVGPPVLPLLPGPSGDWTADEAVIETIALVGGESAMERLREFTGRPDHTVRQALVSAWSGFPAGPYAREVLSRVELDDVVVHVVNDGQLRELHRCGPVPRLWFHGNHRPEALRAHLPRTGLTELSLFSNHELTSLDFLADHPGVEELSLVECTGLGSLAELSDRVFDWLMVDLRTLDLPGRPPRTRSLYVSGRTGFSYGSLRRWNRVERLILPAPVHLPTLIGTVRELPALTMLCLASGATLDLGAVPEAPGITHLLLEGLGEPLDTAGLARAFPSLTRFDAMVAEVPEYTVDLTGLHRLPGLSVGIRHEPGTRLTVIGGEFLGDRLEAGPDT
ncbi:NACHT domain-containing protein [Streptomyces sp. NPDC001985]|uniref:NACHT domain-containing protein n=1 Tax=Streptomyces sp. NPDC001985 TaxID=3154406 RepID=UPI0033278FC4